ncbi:hypothetical protein QBC38DRAFT_442126 [Podospora fimiseda]|uniref:DUF7099 domain-containing protein n=1 Tax=Podospora fimiseda TaxID=252190 RepID=A0AAN7BUM7_9PEZI|nr:hypothetical protein QBC38DRAFT_442126 [Podospora fimiseda]
MFLSASAALFELGTHGEVNSMGETTWTESFVPVLKETHERHRRGIGTDAFRCRKVGSRIQIAMLSSDGGPVVMMDDKGHIGDLEPGWEPDEHEEGSREKLITETHSLHLYCATLLEGGQIIVAVAWANRSKVIEGVRFTRER